MEGHNTLKILLGGGFRLFSGISGLCLNGSETGDEQHDLQGLTLANFSPGRSEQTTLKIYSNTAAAPAAKSLQLCQAALSFTVSVSLLRLVSIESVMPMIAYGSIKLYGMVFRSPWLQANQNLSFFYDL